MSENDSAEAISTEDMLSCVEDLNNQMRRGWIWPKCLLVGSLNVYALLPSIDVKLAGRIYKERLMKCLM